MCKYYIKYTKYYIKIYCVKIISFEILFTCNTKQRKFLKKSSFSINKVLSQLLKLLKTNTIFENINTKEELWRIYNKYDLGNIQNLKKFNIIKMK